jgi:hypothetical protein
MEVTLLPSSSRTLAVDTKIKQLTKDFDVAIASYLKHIHMSLQSIT